MSKFFLRIATPERDAFSGEVEYLSFDTPRGREGIMRGAIPRIAVVSAGKLEITDCGVKTVLNVGDGLIHVERGGVTVVTSRCDGDGADMSNRDGEFGDLTPEIARAKIVSTIKNKNSHDDR